VASFCGNCGEKMNLPMSSVRTSRHACDFCGGFNTYQTRDPRGRVRTHKLPNYSYPDQLMPTATEAVGEEERA